MSFDVRRNDMAKQALEGIKVVDFCWAVAGPTIGLYLAYHGATVVRIESRHRLDLVRTSAPYKDDIVDPDRAVCFGSLNSNKLGMALNLDHPKGIEVARRLVAWSDIVGENFAPGRMKMWGLGYEDLKRVKPDIIMYSSTNLGQTGPEAGQPGYGIQLTAYAGFTHLTGWQDRLAVMPLPWTDYTSPQLLVAAVIAALEYRRRSGKGQYLDLSQMEAAMHSLAPVLLDYTVNGRVATRNGNRSPCAAPHGAYPCQGDDRWCAIAVFTDEEWHALCQVMGNPDWTRTARFATLRERKENEDELDDRVGEWTRQSTAEQMMQRLQAAGVPAGVVKNGRDVLEDPQLAYRHFFWELENEGFGVHHSEGSPFILSKTPYEITRPSPQLGQHTEYICREMLGMSDEEFIDLLNEDVFV